MRPFTYSRTASVEEASALVASGDGARLLAGGTNLVDLMKLGVETPSALVDVTALGLGGVEHRDDGSLLIGATARNSDLAGDRGVRARYPVLAQALLAGASGQIRSSATAAGNLLQRTRCLYFQDVTKACNKRVPGSGCPAIDGHHRDLAVIGTSASCVASHPSDMAVALAALDARVHVRRADGAQQSFGLDDFYLLPGDTPHRETVLEPGDIVTAIEVPAVPAGAAMAYRKVRDRASFAFAVVSVAAVVGTGPDGTISAARVALGGVAPRPWRLRGLEQSIAGRRPERRSLRDAALAEFAHARPLPQNQFKIDLAADVVADIVLRLSGGEPL